MLGGAGYTVVPGAPNCASMATAATGFYQFLLLAGTPSGQYTLTTTSAGFTSPSAIIPPQAGSLNAGPGPGVFPVQAQANAPTGGQSTTYFTSFNLTAGQRDIINNHVPLDPGVGQFPLFLEKSGNVNEIEIGNTIEYTLRLKSPQGAVTNASISDTLPPGFKLVSGTTRIRGVAVAEPAGAPGANLVFPVGNIAVNETVIITYRVRVGVTAEMNRQAVNRAVAKATNGVAAAVQSNLAQHGAMVTGGVFTDEACVVGKVFVDCNNNRIQDECCEVGVPAVRMYFSDGTSLISDSQGKYSYCGISPKTHTFKLDKSTLPKDAQLLTSSNRHAFDAGSLFLDLKNGELHQADFILACQPEVLDAVMDRRCAARANGDVDVPGHGDAECSARANRPAKASKPALEKQPATGTGKRFRSSGANSSRTGSGLLDDKPTPSAVGTGGTK